MVDSVITSQIADTGPVISTFLAASDSAVFIQLPEKTDAYIEVLEKTNQQLSLWWNPYGVMIAALGVLFAVLAIVAAIAIWRQGAGYKNLIDRSILEHRSVLGALVEERLTAMEQRLSGAIDHETHMLKSAGKEQRAQIGRKIAELEEERKMLRERTGSGEAGTEATVRGLKSPLISYLDSVMDDPLIAKRWRYAKPILTCSKCNFQFIKDAHTRKLPSGIMQTNCPRCGSIEE